MQNPSNQDQEMDKDNAEERKPDYMRQDIADSPQDEEKLKGEEVTLDLPDVEDIPGQEHVHVPSMSAIGDTTASSDDEEGVGIFDDEADAGEEAPKDGSDADVTPQEKELLRSADKDMPTRDDLQLKESFLDETDKEGDPINEGSMATDVSGSDLDSANEEDDDAEEEIGEEDEENNFYSIGGDDNDEPPQDNF